MERDFVKRPFILGDGFSQLKVYQVRDQVELHFEDDQGETTGGVAFNLEAALRLAGDVLEAAFAGEQWVEKYGPTKEDD